jgi:hypothetical protein
MLFVQTGQSQGKQRQGVAALFAVCEQLIDKIRCKLQWPTIRGHPLGGTRDDFLEPLRRHRPQLAEQFHFSIGKFRAIL